MTLMQRHILLLTQQAELEAEFKSAVHDARLRVINAANGNALIPLLRRGMDLVAFDMELPPAVLAEGGRRTRPAPRCARTKAWATPMRTGTDFCGTRLSRTKSPCPLRPQSCADIWTSY